MATQLPTQPATQPSRQTTTQTPAQALAQPATQSNGQVNVYQPTYNTQHLVQRTIQPTIPPTMQPFMPLHALSTVPSTTQSPMQSTTQHPIQHNPQPPIPFTMELHGQPTVQLFTQPALHVPTPIRPTTPARIRSIAPKVMTRHFMIKVSSPRSEQAVTLSLTSPGGYFVDIRIAHPIRLPDPGTLPGLPWPVILPLPHVYGALVKPRGERIAFSEADYKAQAICGSGGRLMSRMTPDGRLKTQRRFQVWNEFADCTRIKMWGLTTLTSEVGEDGKICNLEYRVQPLKQPDGSFKTYDECWFAVPVVLDQSKSTTKTMTEMVYGSRATILRPNTNSLPTDRHCIVLMTLHRPGTMFPRGMIIRAGDWCQGVLRTSASGVRLQRWMQGGTWQCVALMDSEDATRNQRELFEIMELICLNPEKVSLGDVTHFQGTRWRVVEATYW